MALRWPEGCPCKVGETRDWQQLSGPSMVLGENSEAPSAGVGGAIQWDPPLDAPATRRNLWVCFFFPCGDTATLSHLFL